MTLIDNPTDGPIGEVLAQGVQVPAPVPSAGPVPDTFDDGPAPDIAGGGSFLAPRAPAAPRTQDPLADMGTVYAPGARTMKRRNRGTCSLNAAEQLERARRAKQVQMENAAYRKANPAPPLPESGPIPHPDGQHNRNYHAGYILHMDGKLWAAVRVSVLPLLVAGIVTHLYRAACCKTTFVA
jgi:hypothetical protein